MNKQKSDLIKMIVWVSICVALMLGLWMYSMCTHQEEKDSKTYNVNEARMKAKELNLKTYEDSVHYYEDGM